MRFLLFVPLILFGLTASSQQFKTVINPEKRLATLKNDTLFVHLSLDKPLKYAHFQNRYITFNGKVYRYKIAYYDPSLFWLEYHKSKRKEIKFFTQ